MHILITTDQHAESLGGVQVSIRLQKRFLERAGHRVTVVATKLFREHSGDPDYVDLPSMPITVDREYSMSLAGRREDRHLDRALRGRPPVDVVHVQGDFWGALVGYRFAARHGVPVVHTMHNNLEFGMGQVVPVPRLAARALLLWQRLMLGPTRSTLPAGAWRFLHEYTLRADAVTTPSGHFARLLESKGVAPNIDVIWNGVDDEIIDDVLAAPGGERGEGLLSRPRPVFVWTGRMSHEKRILEFLEAVYTSRADAEFRIYGGGLLLKKARAFVATHGLTGRVRFMGSVPYRDSLAGIADADALVQTSIGFETQGMTVFEAAALGTPSIVSDPNIAGELPRGTYWQPEDHSVQALADAIALVAGQVTAGVALRPAPQTSVEFRQSHQTTRMIAVYERVLGRG
ncbi:glycosyltransferase [Okibacterium endophyticum]